MQQIFNFIIRNKTFLLFLLLFSISILLTIQSHSYHKSKFINSANFLTGGIYGTVNDINSYFNLKEQNDILSEENNRLKSIIFNKKDVDSVYIDSSSFSGNYKFQTARILKNSYSSSNNILTINKGKKDNIKQDLGVISSKGLVGIIDNTSKNYATVISVLNTKSSISALLKETNHIGSLTWNGKSPEIIQLTDIPKIAEANLNVGDTITTSGQSVIFPKGIPIGTVDKFKLDAAENYFEIEVRLFNDMTSIEHVYIIENVNRDEINTLLDNSNE